VRFTRLRRGGYDIQEVDSFLSKFAELLESENIGNLNGEVDDNELYDPEGAAQRLLAAAQRTADSVTKEAVARAEQLTASAEAQADNIKRVVVEEARRLAEQSQADLEEKIDELYSKRKDLEDRCGFLEGQLNAGKDQLLSVIDEMRKIVEESDLELLVLEDGIEEFGENASKSDLEQMADRDEPQRENQMAHQADISPVGDIHNIGSEDLEDPMDHTEEELEDAIPPELSLVHSTEELESWIDAAAAGAEEGINKYWLDDEEDLGPPTQISPVVQAGEGASGDRFFEELRDSDPHESVLGLVDDETDAAISSFLSDEE